jgi:thiamine pyrophosphate-dependent acetolactate synthase large subunit-like protein
MNHDTLYAANFPVDTDENSLRQLFEAHGEVVSVSIHTDEKTSERYALVRMSLEKNATKALNALNGHVIGERRLAVSYPEADRERELTSKQKKAVEAFCAELGEKDGKPTRQIEMLVRLCGSAFVQAIISEALAVDAAGGLMTLDGKRRRSKGGVFFFLAHNRVSAPVRHIVFTRKGRFPVETASETPAEG